MADPLARAIAAEALALRASHAHAPVVDVLDLVMRSRDRRQTDFGDLADPPHPLALLIAEAFDTVMTPKEGAGMIAHCDPSQRDALIGVGACMCWIGSCRGIRSAGSSDLTPSWTTSNGDSPGRSGRDGDALVVASNRRAEGGEARCRGSG